MQTLLLKIVMIRANYFVLRVISRRKKHLKLPASIDAQSFVDDLGSFFVQKIVDIRARLDTEETSVNSSSNPEVSTLPPETMEEFKELTEDDVKSLIQRSSLKSCSLDPIPSK